MCGNNCRFNDMPLLLQLSLYSKCLWESTFNSYAPSNKLLPKWVCAHYYSNRFPFLHKMYTFISRKVKMFRLIWVRLVRFAKVRNCLVLVLFHCLLLLFSNLNPFPILHFNVNFAYLSALFSIYSPFNSIQFNSLLIFCFVSGKEHVKLHQKSNNYAQNIISFIAQLKTVNSCNSCL